MNLRNSLCLKPWVVANFDQQIADAVEAALAPELEPLVYTAKKLDGLRLCIWFRASQQQDAEILLNILTDYLQEKEGSRASGATTEKTA